MANNGTPCIRCTLLLSSVDVFICSDSEILCEETEAPSVKKQHVCSISYNIYCGIKGTIVTSSVMSCTALTFCSVC